MTTLFRGNAAADRRYCDSCRQATLDHIEMRYAQLETEIQGIVKTIESRLQGMDHALRVEAKEMERRLAGLNELRADVVADRDQFVRREVYMQTVSNAEKWREEYINSHSVVVNRVTVLETRSLVWGSVVVIFFLLLQVVAHFWKG